MKLTNISSEALYFQDLQLTAALEFRRGEDRYLAPYQSVYLPNTSEVLRSTYKGEIRRWWNAGLITLEDQVALDATGGPNASVVLTHNFGFPPHVFVLKQVTSTWVDATGTIDIIHNAIFTTVTVTNTTAFPLTFMIRLLN